MSIHYGGIGEVFIDAHGPGHGLMVASDGETVTMRTYGEFCEANAETGQWEGVFEETSVDIRELFRPDAKHLEHVDLTCNVGHEDRPRKADIIINAALAWIAYWGCGDSDGRTFVDVETDGGSCAFFGEYWPGTDEKHLRCEVCEERRAESLRSAVREYAYDRAWSEYIREAIQLSKDRIGALKNELHKAIENEDDELLQEKTARKDEIESALKFFGESSERWIEVDICDNGSVWLGLTQIIENDTITGRGN